MLGFFAIVWMASQGSAHDFYVSGKGLALDFLLDNPSHLKKFFEVGRRGGTATGRASSASVPPSHLVPPYRARHDVRCARIARAKTYKIQEYVHRLLRRGGTVGRIQW